MTDLEINKALAIAIGWTENRIGDDGLPDPDVAIFGYGGYHQHYGKPDEVKCWDGDDWRAFSHKDWATIGPIAERYACFPVKAIGGWYSSNWFEDKEVAQMYADTPQRAIAMAVIQGAKK